MKSIPLTKGYSALVDDADYAILSLHKWCAWSQRGKRNVYAMRNVVTDGFTASGKRKLRTFKMHRVLLGVNDPKVEVDHKDGDGLNNVRDNLRIATRTQNAANTAKRRTARTSRFKGVSVSWIARAKNLKRPWLAQVNNGHSKQREIGHFASELGAAAAYNASAWRTYGAFARLNSLSD